ncbi:Hypothetical predicted protein [Cloeon dipterum]|uniref:Peptidase S1 domain-containing protein n=1 Tax=Cloeon dipterum TaxID=197152 RepID=A0A8S1CWT6_9INSE|nr:Hypothetical predicted protein [Cloeon dipterum]
MHLAELIYETEEGGKKRRKSRSTCSFCIRLTLVALLIILLAVTTITTIFFLLGRGEIEHGECRDSVTTTQRTTTPTTTSTVTITTTTPPPPSSTTTPQATTNHQHAQATTTTTPPTTTTTTTTAPPTTTTTTKTTTKPPTTKTTTKPPTTKTTTTPPTTTTSKTTTSPPPPPPPTYIIMISVNNGEWYCGGSLIKKNRVLTARQCCMGANMYTIFLVGNDEPSRQIGTSFKSMTHDDFDLSKLDDGICVIHLDTSVSCEGVTTIRMPSRSQCSESFERYNATFSGWERSSNDDTSSTHLIHTDVIIEEKRFCKRVFPEASTERTLCTYDANGFGICNRYAGYPLTITESDGVETQIGIASFGPPPDVDGCETHYPNGFVRVTKFLFKIGMYAGLDFRP